MMRRGKGRIPKIHRLDPGRWHRDPWFSVARVGAWSLRVHHKRDGWRAHVRCGSWHLCDLPAPVTTRAAAERAILEAAEGLCAGVQTALDALPRHPLRETFPDPPASDPGWRQWRKRKPGHWYRSANATPPSLPASEANCGAFRLLVFRSKSGVWCASVESGIQPIFVEWSLLRTKIRTRDHGETVALAAARMRLAEITAALETLRGDVESPPRPEPASDHHPGGS